MTRGQRTLLVLWLIAAAAFLAVLAFMESKYKIFALIAPPSLAGLLGGVVVDIPRNYRYLSAKEFWESHPGWAYATVFYYGLVGLAGFTAIASGFDMIRVLKNPEDLALVIMLPMFSALYGNAKRLYLMVGIEERHGDQAG